KDQVGRELAYGIFLPVMRQLAAVALGGETPPTRVRERACQHALAIGFDGSSNLLIRRKASGRSRIVALDLHQRPRDAAGTRVARRRSNSHLGLKDHPRLQTIGSSQRYDLKPGFECSVPILLRLHMERYLDGVLPV